MSQTYPHNGTVEEDRRPVSVLLWLPVELLESLIGYWDWEHVLAIRTARRFLNLLEADTLMLDFEPDESIPSTYFSQQTCLESDLPAIHQEWTDTPTVLSA